MINVSFLFRIVSFLLFFLIFNSMYLIGVESYFVAFTSKVVFYISIFLLFGMLVIGRSSLSSDRYFFFLTFFLFVFWVFFRASGVYGIIVACQAAVVLLLSLALSGANDDCKNYLASALKISAVFFLVVSSIHLVFARVFANDNFWGLYCLVFLVASLGFERRWRFLVFPFFVFLVLSGTRSALLGFFVSLALLLFLKSTWQAKVLQMAFFLFVFILLFAVGFFDYLMSPEFAVFVMDVTGKRIESGRVEIWSTIFSTMSIKDWIIGIGGGYDLASIIGVTLSVHSGYIHILSSFGLIGLLLFFVLIFLFSRASYKKGWAITFLMITALVVREFFEVSLLNNNFPVAIFFWGILASGAIDKTFRREVV
jgi:O-antigen ligase